MGLGYKNNINAAVTAVSNTFIDEYMGTASGEYVKVYLYLLRHDGENVEIPDIADALEPHRGGCPPRSGLLGACGCSRTGKRIVESRRLRLREMAKRQKIQARGSQKTVRMTGSAPDGKNERTEIRADDRKRRGTAGWPSMEKPANPGCRKQLRPYETPFLR